MAGGDDLTVATLSLGDEGVQVDETLDAVRKSVIVGDVEQFLATAGDLGDKSPLVYLMDWLHTWQQEYEAFVHVLGIQEGAGDEEEGQEQGDAEKDLEEMEAEAEKLMTGFGKVATALLQRLGVKNPDTVVDRHGWTLLMQAANSGLLELTEELIARKADVNYGGSATDTSNPLYLAVESEHSAVALLLLKNGAIESATKLVTTPSVGADAGDEDEDDDDDAEDDDCALFQACRFGHISVIKEMLALGADVNFALPSNGDRALHVAVMFEMQEVVELLAGSDKIDLNALNEIGQTCLFGCSGLELAKLLIAKGVDPKIKDVDGETALSVAQALGDDEVAEYLSTVTL